MSDKWKDIIIALILAILTISGMAYFVDIVLIDGLDIDQGFLGSIIGGVIGGLVAFGVAWLQVQNLRKEEIEKDRTYISASTPICIVDEEIINRRPKNKIILTDDLIDMGGLNKKVTYYSLIRFGGSEAIWDVDIRINVGGDIKFNKQHTIKVWVDFFEKEEEILIPLCSKDIKVYQPYIKDITVTYRTDKNERIEFYQSELDNVRKHYLIENGNKIMLQAINTKHIRWTTKIN